MREDGGVGILRLTLDTNASSEGVRFRIEQVCDQHRVTAELAITTVTVRETEGTNFAQATGISETGVYDESLYDSGAIYAGDRVSESRTICESLVLDESRLGEAVLSDSDPLLERILEIIGNGSFPRVENRDDLTTGERRQLRDAMALEAHAREKRDVFISNDTTAFVKGGRRVRLEALCHTRVATVDEFCSDPKSYVDIEFG